MLARPTVEGVGSACGTRTRQAGSLSVFPLGHYRTPFTGGLRRLRHCSEAWLCHHAAVACGKPSPACPSLPWVSWDLGPLELWDRVRGGRRMLGFGGKCPRGLEGQGHGHVAAGEQARGLSLLWDSVPPHHGVPAGAGSPMGSVRSARSQEPSSWARGAVVTPTATLPTPGHSPGPAPGTLGPCPLRPPFPLQARTKQRRRVQRSLQMQTMTPSIATWKEHVDQQSGRTYSLYKVNSLSFYSEKS